MKLRCTENSIRIRLRRSEIETLKRTHCLNEKVAFPNQQSLSYSIHVAGNLFQSSFKQGKIIITIPVELAEEWLNSDQVGIDKTTKLGSGQKLEILLEKDFPCKDRPEEDKTDLFQDLAKSDTNC